jgi:hypothetical protein
MPDLCSLVIILYSERLGRLGVIKKIGFTHKIMIKLENNVKTTAISKVKMGHPTLNC